MISAKDGRTEWVEELIKSRADVNMKDIVGRTALINAAEYGRIDCVRLLLKAGSDVNVCTEMNSNYTHDHTALSKAACKGEAEIFDMLLEAGADVNMKNSLGRTALSYAAKYGKVDCVRL